MMQTKFGQFIYTSLTFDKSPVKKPGYHIHYWTKSYLSDSDVENLESYIAYYKSGSNPVKLQFFSLQSGKFVFIKTKLTDVVDEYNRKIFFAHGYIFEPSTFSAVFRNDPFRVFDEFVYYYELNNAIGLEALGNIPEKIVDYKESEIIKFNIPNWLHDYSHLQPILNLAMQAHLLVKTRKEVQIIGEGSQIEDVLRTVLLLSPLTVRPWCSFDTHYYNCNIPGKFWVLGLPEPTNDSYIISASTGEINKTTAPIQETPYERWLRMALRKYGIQGAITKVPKACFYIDTILGKEIYSKDILFDNDEIALLSDLTSIFFREIDRRFNEIAPMLQIKFIPPVNSLEKLSFLIELRRTPNISIREYFPSRVIESVVDPSHLESDGFKKKRLSVVSVAFDRLANILKKKIRR